MITSFRGSNAFLSNMYASRVEIDGIVYLCAEAAFQAAKCADPNDKLAIARLSGPDAKHYGRRVRLVPNWNEKRVNAMREVLYAKFSQPRLRELLIATEPHALVEINTWNDRFWGMTLDKNGKPEGANTLGKLLMEVRATPPLTT